MVLGTVEGFLVTNSLEPHETRKARNKNDIIKSL